MTCCCIPGCGTTCNWVNVAQQVCSWDRYLLTASGFTGTAGTYFNGTVAAKFCGFYDGANEAPKWSTSVTSPNRAEFYLLGPSLADYNVDYFIRNILVARYQLAVSINCDGSNTFTKISGTGPATITVANDTGFGGWVCECWSQQPMPYTLKLNVSNSNCALIANGMYTLTYTPVSPPTGNWTITIGNTLISFSFGNVNPTWVPEGCGASSTTLLLQCNAHPCMTNIGTPVTNASSCTCSPLFAAGHTDLATADGGLCDGSPAATGFDWTVTP